MKKIIVLLIAVLVIGSSVLAFAETTRDTPRKFMAFSSNTEGLQACNIYRITGVATNSNAVFGIYNEADLEDCALTNLAVEGGEATSGDALPMYDFGDEGLNLNAAMSVVVSTCTIVVEYY